jgi:hypothetical protein
MEALRFDAPSEGLGNRPKILGTAALSR